MQHPQELMYFTAAARVRTRRWPGISLLSLGDRVITEKKRYHITLYVRTGYGRWQIVRMVRHPSWPGPRTWSTLTGEDSEKDSGIRKRRKKWDSCFTPIL